MNIVGAPILSGLTSVLQGADSVLHPVQTTKDIMGGGVMNGLANMLASLGESWLNTITLGHADSLIGNSNNASTVNNTTNYNISSASVGGANGVNSVALSTQSYKGTFGQQ
jgi:hypothetical protein